MKRFFSVIISIAILFSIAVPASVSAATAKVTGLKQTGAGSDYVKFEWSAVFGKDVSYDIQMGYSPNDLTTVRSKDDWYSNDTNYTAYSLTAGSTYYARVRAYSDNAYGAWSDTLELVTAPEKVKNFIQTDCTETTASFKWDASEGATSYKLIERIGDSDNVLAAVKGTSCTIKGLNNKTAFKNDFYVSPVRENKTYAAETSINTTWDVNAISSGDLKLTPKKPDAPSIVTIWTVIDICDYRVSGVPFANGYQFELYNGSNKKTKSGDAGSGVGVKSGQFFALRTRGYVKLSSTNKVRYGKWSDKKYFGYNLNASAKKAKNKKSIKVNWKKFKGASDYTVFISKSSKGGYKKAALTKKTTLKIKKFGKKKLKKNTTYYVKVVANKKVNKKTVATVNTVMQVK